MQTGNIKFFIIILLLITGCVKTDINILQKDISRYSAIEEELNIKIKLVNNQMIKAIEKYKNTKDKQEFDKDNQLINEELTRLLNLAKEVNMHIASKEVKKYHTVTIKLLEIQAEYVKVTINQFENMGEHGNNDAKLTEIKYNKKIRTLQKEQDKLLKNIINDMKEK